MYQQAERSYRDNDKVCGISCFSEQAFQQDREDNAKHNEYNRESTTVLNSRRYDVNSNDYRDRYYDQSVEKSSCETTMSRRSIDQWAQQ